MLSLPIISIIFILSIISLCGLIGYLVFIYFKEQNEEKKRFWIYHTASKVVEDAHKKALGIIYDAELKSKNMLLHTEYLRNSISDDFSQSLKKTEEKAVLALTESSEGFYEDYKKSFEKEKEEYMGKLEDTFKALVSISIKQVDEFSKKLTKDTLNSEVFIGAKIQEQIDQAEKDISEYKQRKLSQLDSSIAHVIEKVASQVIGKTLSLSEHERLVLEAFEQAKKENMFSSEQKITIKTEKVDAQI